MRLGDVLGARSEDVEDEVPAGLEQLTRGSQGPQLLVLALHVQERAERADHELHALVYRRLAHVADPKVDEVADATLLGEGARHREHSLREVDADHGPPRLRDRNRDPARSDRELDDRPLAALRLLDVERDVLDDRGAPRVVDPCDGVVEGHVGQV